VQPCSFHRCIGLLEQINFDRDQDDLNLFAQSSANELVIPDYFVQGERDILLRFERDDFIKFFSSDRRQFYKPGEHGLRGQSIVHRAPGNLHLVHHLAQHAGALLQRNMCVATLPGLWIERQFAEAIIHENQTAVGDSEFGNTNRLRSEVKSDQARRSGHGVKGVNRNSKMPKKNFSAKYNQVEGVVLNALVTHALCRLISCAFSEWNTSS